MGKSRKELWLGYDGPFTCVPNEFLKRAAEEWGLEPIHMQVMIHLLMYRWDERHPYPSIATLAKGIGRKSRRTQEAVSDLEHRFKLLRRIVRMASDGDQDSNAYDLDPLF